MIRRRGRISGSRPLEHHDVSAIRPRTEAKNPPRGPLGGLTEVHRIQKRIISILKEHEAGMKTAALCRKYEVSEATFYNWNAKYGGLDVSEAKRLKGLESENAKLKKLLADVMLDNAALKDLLAKNCHARYQARSCRSPALCVRHERAAGVQGRHDYCSGSRIRPSTGANASYCSSW
jgi:putative transposase